MTILSLILGFALGASALVFALQNNEVISLALLGWQFESSLALVFLLAVTAGLILGILISIPSIVRRSLVIMSLKREIQSLQVKIAVQEGGSQAVDIRDSAMEPQRRADI